MILRKMPGLVFAIAGSHCVYSAAPVVAQVCPPPVDFGFAAHSWTESGAIDCVLAVGEQQLLVGTNLGFWFFSRDGDQVEFVTRGNFFPSPIDAFGDPIVMFDRDSLRYFVLIMSGDFPDNDLALAVSTSSDPELNDPQDWHFYEFTDLPGKVDFPNMSIGEDYVYVTWARVGAEPLGRAVIASLTKADLISGEEPTFTAKLIDHIEGQATSPQFRAIGCMKMYSQPSSSIGYFITDSHKESGVNTWVRLYALNASSNTLYTHELTVPDYYTAPIKIRVPGTNAEVTCHWDFKFPVYRNGSAWAAHAIGPEAPSEELKTAKVRWYEIAMNGWPVSQDYPELVQYGTINPGSAVSAWYPAIHVDDDGNVAIAYNQASASQHPAIYRQIRKWYDDEGALRAPLLLKQSESSPAGSNPWADYSAMDEDPEYPGVMWSHLMWFAGESTRKTWVARTDLNQSMPLAISPTTTPIMRGTYVTLSVEGAGPGNLVRWYHSTHGCGSTYIPALDVTLDLDTAEHIGSSTADANGDASKSFTVPNDFPLGVAHLQAAEAQNTSAVLDVTVSGQ